MKHKLTLICLLFSLSVFAQNEVLTNSSIIEMVRDGFSNETIIGKIRNTRSNFKTTTSDLGVLKRAKVPEAVIKAMLNPRGASAMATTTTTNSGSSNVQSSGGGSSVSTTTNITEENDVNGEESGIFYVENGEMIKVESSPISAAKAKSFGNTFLHDFTNGLTKKQSRLILKGEHSTAQIATSRPEFIFIFDKENASLNSSSGEKQEKGLLGAITKITNAAVDYRYGKMGSARSPKDFVLAKTENVRDKKTREMLTAGETAYDYGGGLDPAILVDFKVKRTKEGHYKVTFSNDLPPGEYVFFYGNARATQRSTQELNLIAFDFGIQ